MRRALAVVAAVGMVIGWGIPAGADDARQGHYSHHDRYQGDYYDYPDYHGDPYKDDGPYDGYYDCRPKEGPRHSQTWCDHYYGRHS